MYKIIGADQKEYGPVTAEQIRQWIAESRLNGQSLVQAEGSSEWKRLSAFPEFAEALRAQAGQVPLAGAASVPASAAAWSEQILALQPELRIGQCLGRSWSLLTANFGVLFGATAVAWFITLVCGFIPFIGGLISWLLQGVLYGGVYLILLRRIRGQPASIRDVFVGFSLGFGQLMLVGFLTKLLTSIGACCCLLPGLYLFVAWTFSVPLVADKGLEFWSAMELSRKVVTRVWFEIFGLLVVAFLPFILTYVFAEVRISSSAFSAVQDVMSASQPDFGHLMQVIMQIAKRSLPLVFLIKFVLLLNLPFALGALMYAYESLFGTRTTPNA